MKRSISLIITLCLLVSLVACKSNGGGSIDGTADGSANDSETTAYIDPSEILGKYRANGFYESFMLSSEVSIYNMSTNFAIYNVTGTLKTDISDNIYFEETTTSASVTDCEYVIGNEYYKGSHPDSVSKNAEGVRVVLTDSERAEIANELYPIYLREDLTLLFSDIKCLEEDGRYTVLCHSEDANIISRFTDSIDKDLYKTFAEDSEFSFVSVDYQLIIDENGALIAYAVAATFLVATDDIIEEGSLENYYSYVFVAAVSNYGETLSPFDFSLSDVILTEKTYAEVFGN